MSDMLTGTWIDWLYLIPILMGTYGIWSITIKAWIQHFKDKKEKDE